MPPKRSKAKPSPVGDAVTEFLKTSGLQRRVTQGSIVARWSTLVGPKIAAATRALHVTADGTLFVEAKSSAWMSELTLLEPELLRALNAESGEKPIRKIRYRLMR